MRSAGPVQRWLAVAVLAAPPLGACTGSLFQSKVAPAATYLLAPAAVAGVAAPTARAAGGGTLIPADLAVLKPRVRAGLETDRIAVLYPDHRLDYFADARWSGPLAEALQDAAVQVLHERAQLRGVSGDASVFASGYWLELEVSDFQAEYAAGAEPPTVHVRLMGRLGSSADRGILDRFVVEAREPAAANRLSEIVAAYSRAAGAALGEIAARATATLANGGPAREAAAR